MGKGEREKARVLAIGSANQPRRIDARSQNITDRWRPQSLHCFASSSVQKRWRTLAGEWTMRLTRAGGGRALRCVACHPCSCVAKISTYSFNKITEDSILSSSLWQLLFHPPFENPTASGVSEMLEPARPSINPSPHFAKSKRVLQQTRQLLFDCVREMTENHAKKMKDHQQHNCDQFLEAEEIGKLVYEKLGSWGSKQAGHQANVNFLLESDLLASAEEWGDNYQERREIGSEIGDAILQDIIKDIF